MTPSARPLGRFLSVTALAYLALTLLVFRPTPQRIAGSILSDTGDPLFIASVIEWVATSAQHGFAGLWNQPIFFPLRGALALSEHMVNPGLLAALLPSSVPRGLLVFNLAAIASFPAGALATAFVLRRTGLPPLAAVVGGLVYGFAPYRFTHLSHLAVLLSQWIPLLLWSWDRLLAMPTRRRALAFAALYTLHVTGGAYLAYMAHVPLAIIAVLRLRRQRRELLQRASLRVLLPTLGWCALAASLVFVPYALISHRLGLVRRNSEIVHWGATLWSYVTPSGRYAYSAWWPVGFARSENELFAGFLPTLLAVVGLVGLVRKGTKSGRPHPHRWTLFAAALAALAALVLADIATVTAPAGNALAVASFDHKGPAWLLLAAIGAATWLTRRQPTSAGLSWWRQLTTWERGLLLAGAVCALLTLPVVFLPARHVLPGLSGMRVPTRFYPFISLPIAYLAARGVAGLAARLSPRAGILASLAVALVLAWEISPRVPWAPVPDLSRELPGTHQWLTNHRDQVGAYLELPLGDLDSEILGMYYQTRHWVPMVNGYSGYFPDVLGLRRCCTGPDLDANRLATLRQAGVTHLLIGHWKISPGEMRQWKGFERRLLRRGWVRQRFRDGQGRVFEILPAPSATPGSAARAAAGARPDHPRHRRWGAFRQQPLDAKRGEQQAGDEKVHQEAVPGDRH